jgi:hypothetical protein
MSAFLLFILPCEGSGVAIGLIPHPRSHADCLSLALRPFVGPWTLFQFLNVYTVGRTPWMGHQPIVSPLPTHKITQTQNKRTQTSIP